MLLEFWKGQFVPSRSCLDVAASAKSSVVSGMVLESVTPLLVTRAEAPQPLVSSDACLASRGPSELLIHAVCWEEGGFWQRLGAVGRAGLPAGTGSTQLHHVACVGHSPLARGALCCLYLPCQTMPFVLTDLWII